MLSNLHGCPRFLCRRWADKEGCHEPEETAQNISMTNNMKMLSSGAKHPETLALKSIYRRSDLQIYLDIGKIFHVSVMFLNNCLMFSCLLWDCGSLLVRVCLFSDEVWTVHAPQAGRWGWLVNMLLTRSKYGNPMAHSQGPSMGITLAHSHHL